ncbi:MAG: beta-galactosidase, partial [Verrucomicrobiota bacterium]
MKKQVVAVLAVVVGIAIMGCSAETNFGGQAGLSTESSWIWYPEDVEEAGPDDPRFMRKTFVLESAPKRAELRVLADDMHTLWVNGKPVESRKNLWGSGIVYEFRDMLRRGENVLAFKVVNGGGMGGLVFQGEVEDSRGCVVKLRSDPSVRVSRKKKDGWLEPGFKDSSWKPASIVGSAFVQPWFQNALFDVQPFLTRADWERRAVRVESLFKLPPGLAEETPVKAGIGWENGSCVLRFNGEAEPAQIYRGTVDPTTEHGRRQIALFRDAGVHTYMAELYLAHCWLAPGKYDFTLLDETVRGYLSVDPDARLILEPRLIPPSWWMEAHPNELVGYAKGNYNSIDEIRRVRRASLASEVWRQDALEMWRAMIRHLESKPWGGRVVGYQPGYGIYGEWHYFGSWVNEMPDTGPAMTKAFRQWLRERYGSSAALRKAWGRDDVSLDSATVPGIEPRLAKRPLGMYLPVEDQWVIDYYRCQQKITADALEGFCAAAKKETGGRAFTGAFYGYHLGVLQQAQGGHLELERLFKSPAIDYFAAPYEYFHRKVGDDGRGRAVVDAFPLAGKVHLVEVDTRTHLHHHNEHG